MSKMKKDFQTKSALRCMADGGIAGLAGQRQRVLDQAENAAVRGTPATAAPTPVARPPSDQEQAKSVGISIPAQAPAKPAEKPGFFGTLRRAVGLADGGDPWASMYKAAKPAATMPTAANPITVNPAAAPAAAPVATAAAPVAAAPAMAAPTHSVATANVNFATPDQSRGVDWAGSAGMKMSPTGYPTGLRRGGEVKGPGGPREDKVGPFMLSDGEYVLPAKTVAAMGGKEELDEVVRSTNDGREPGAEFKKEGLRGAAGGVFAVGPDGTTTYEPWKRLPGPATAPAAPVTGTSVAPWDPVTGQRPGAPGAGPQLPTKSPRLGPVYDYRPSGPTMPMGGPDYPKLPPPEPAPTWKQTDGTRGFGRKGSPEMQAFKESLRTPAPSVEVPAAGPSAPSGGLRGKVIGGVSKALAPVAIGVAGYNTAKEIADTPTEDYRTRLSGFVPDKYMNYQKGDTDKDILYKDIGTRAVGAMTDLVNPFGLFNGFFKDKQAKAGAAPAASAPADSALRVAGNGAQMGPPEAQPSAGMSRDGYDTGGKILQAPGQNTFYGGVDPAKAAQLQDIEAQRGRERYARDAQGMYAAIQGHIANGDLETANKLAWDPQSRALVNQGYAERRAAMAAANQPNGEDAINARYDKIAEGLRSKFSSDRAQGNLAKHLDQLNQTRMAELGNFRNNQTQQRGQDALSATARSKQASDEAIAAQRNSVERQKMVQDQMNKDRDFQLNASKYGTEVAKMLFDQKQSKEKAGNDLFDNFVKNKFVKSDLLGKQSQDLQASSAFRDFVLGSAPNFHSLEDTEQKKILVDALPKFQIMQASNDKKGIGGKTTTQFQPSGAPRPSELADVVDRGLPISTYLGTKLRPWGDRNVVPFEDGQVRGARDLGSDDSIEIQNDLYRGLRRK